MTGEAQSRLARSKRATAMKDEERSPARKVGIYDRPAGSDRPWRLLVYAAAAIAIAIAAGVLLFA
jgi:hypothetical protein